MRITVLLTATGLVLAASAVPASAALEPAGRMCGFTSTSDLTQEPGWQAGDINAGPVVTGADGTLHCKIVVNGYGHSSPYAVDESVAAVGGVAVMAPRELHYRATAADGVSICTSWVPATGPTLYWVHLDVWSDLSPGYWTTAATAPCSIYHFEESDPDCPILLAVDQRLGTNLTEVWKDCEGYEPII